jgi:hypothetical protein
VLAKEKEDSGNRNETGVGGRKNATQTGRGANGGREGGGREPFQRGQQTASSSWAWLRTLSSKDASAIEPRSPSGGK